MGMYGACLIAPIGYGFFNLLRRIVPPSSSPLKRALKKVHFTLLIALLLYAQASCECNVILIVTRHTHNMTHNSWRWTSRSGSHRFPTPFGCITALCWAMAV
jgi:hypothetical protein